MLDSNTLQLLCLHISGEGEGNLNQFPGGFRIQKAYCYLRGPLMSRKSTPTLIIGTLWNSS